MTNHHTTSKIVRVVVGLMLIAALGSWEYSFYQLLRVAVCSASIYLVWYFFQTKTQWLAWLFIVSALLFNPIAPVYLDKSVWQLLDITFAILFLGSLAIGKK